VQFEAKKDAPWAAAAALLGMLACWPYLWVLGIGAMSRDAVLWLERSQFGKPIFFEWVFQTQHFKVGYRPVTGLSYALNGLLGGYRITDLLLHVACVVLVYVLYRRLAPALPRWGGLVSAFVMAAHPLAEFVVPHLARRGYPLATAWSLAGLALLAAPGKARWLGALCIGLGALSNDAAYAVFVLGALVVLARDRDRGSLAALGAVLVTLLAVRFAVIGGVGGYQTNDRTARIVPIFFATWDRLLPFFGDIELPLAPVRTALAGLGATLLSAAALWSAAARDEAGKALALALAWIVGLTLLFLPNGVWFPRQVYLLVAPMSLVVGLLAAQLRPDDRTSWLRAAPALAVVLAVLVRSPVLWGTDPVQQQAWRQTEAIVADLTTAMEQVKRREKVALVVPFFKRPSQGGLRAREGEDRRRADPLGARIIEQRVENDLGRAKQMGTAALWFADPAAPQPLGSVSPTGGLGFEVQAAPATRLSVYAGELLTDDDEGGRGQITIEAGWLYVHDGAEGRLERVE